MSKSNKKQPQTDIDEKIDLLVQEIRSFLVQVEAFFQSLKQQQLFRKVVLHKEKSGLEKFDTKFRDIYIPEFCWIEYIGEKRIYLQWENIAYILNRANATLDERVLHIKMEYEFQRLRLEVKSAVNRLKDMLKLSNDFMEILNNQQISLKMFYQFVR